jgi:ethanolamine utilization protein EutN
MKIGRVASTVVSTIKHPALDGRRLLAVDLLDLEGHATGRDVVAVDSVGAGAGETVLVLDEGNGARQVLKAAQAPVRAVIVGIIDELLIDDRSIL